MRELAIFLILFYFQTIALADNGLCSLNGQWFDTNLQNLPMYKLRQVDSKITRGEEATHPICGEYLIEGITNGKTFHFKLFMSKTDDEYCRTWSEFFGEFSSSECSKIKGNYTFHWEFNNTHYESTVPFSWYRNIVKIISPDPKTELVITAEPKMPEFKAAAILEKPDPLNYLSRMTTVNYNSPPFAWNLRIKHSPIPGRLNFDVSLDEVTSNNPTFTPNFNLLRTINKHELIDGGIMGGELTLSVDYYKAVHDEKKYIIKGTNPGKTVIEKILTDTVTRQIACQESRYRQFKANREGGVGFPVIGLDDDNEPKGGAGIMQLYKPKPTAAQVWNWQENLKAGLVYFSKKYTESKHAHILETIRLNNERKKKGMPLCPMNAITPLNEEQLNRETLRRYNCGREYRWEPRDAPNCEGKWVIDLSCKREKKKGYDPNYVDKVLNCNIDV